LNLKGGFDAFGFDIDGDGSAGEGDGDVGSLISWYPCIVELRIDVVMLIMKGGFQIVGKYLIDFIFQKISDGLSSHNIVKHFPECNFVIVSGISGVDTSQRQSLFAGKLNRRVIEEVVAVGGAVLDDDGLGEIEDVTESAGDSCAVACDNALFGPVERDVDL
jgi:hypothetical protein